MTLGDDGLLWRIPSRVKRTIQISFPALQLPDIFGAGEGVSLRKEVRVSSPGPILFYFLRRAWGIL